MNDDYQRIATIYNKLFSSFLDQLRKDIRTYIFYKRYQRVVDICCGTGEQLRLLDRPGMQLCGIDNSLAMLKVARSSCPEHIQLHLLDAEQSSFAGATFDCAIISLSLHDKHPTVAKTIFSNAYQLVREQGAVIVADYNRPALSISGFFIGKILIPIIEKSAGKPHYNHYSKWMNDGGLERFLERKASSTDIISQTLGGTLLCCAVRKDDSKYVDQQSFGLLQKTITCKD